MRLEIAGFHIAVDAGALGTAVDVPAPARAFLAGDGTPDVTIAASWADLADPSPGERIFDAGTLWQLYRTCHGLEFRFTSAAFGPTPYRVARFDDHFTTGEVLLHRPYFERRPCPSPIEYPLDELIVIHRLALAGGLEVHGCGVIDREGTGYLFPGQSGAGKSTMARLWESKPRVEILSDDRIVLRRQGGGVWMYGTPWHGEARLASPSRARLAGIAFLEHGATNARRPLPPAAAAARLMACSFVPFYAPEAIEATLITVERIVQEVACETLAFVPTRAVVDLIRASAVGVAASR